MAGSTHDQRRKAQQIKSDWVERVVGGSHSLEDLVNAAQGNSEDAKYLGSILLVDLLAKVHPGLSRGQIVSELEGLPIKAPADPSRFSIRSIRSRPELVEQVSAMTQASEMTKNAKGRTEVPTNWPWTTKLSDLIRINSGEMPQGLDWLETGEGVDPSDLLLSGEEVDSSFRSTEPDVDPEGVDAPDAPQEATEPEQDAQEESRDDSADEEDPFAELEAELLGDGGDEHESEDDPIAAEFGDILGEDENN